MGRIYRRSKEGRYWGEYYTPEGQRVRRSLKTTDKRVAKERLRQAELDATPKARGKKQLLSEAIDYMINTTCHDKAEATREFYRQKGRSVDATLGDPYVASIDRDMLSKFIGTRIEQRASPHTIQKELITIRRALREAHDRGVLTTMPAFPRWSTKYQPRETWLTPDQFEAVCAELAPERRLWASIAALAGASAGEVERVAWLTVDTVANRLLIPGRKRETRHRWVPIAPALLHRLLEVAESKRAGLVVQLWGNVRRDLHSAVARANVKAVAAAAARGEPSPTPIPKVSPNDLRRTFASWLVQQGVPLLTVATLMGHSSTRMVERVYGRLSKQNLDSAIALLPSFRWNGESE